MNNKLLIYSPNRVDTLGGAEKALLNIGRYLSKKNKVIYFSLYNRGQGDLRIENIEKEYGLCLSEYPSFKEGFIRRYINLIKIIRNTDIVYFCNLYLKDELIVILLTKLFNKKIITVYQSSFAYPKSFFRNISNRLIKRRLIKYYDGVQLLNESEKEYFSDNGAKRINVIPNGIDPNIYKPNNFKKFKNKTFNLLFVGRLEDQKGITYLIDVINKLNKSKIIKFRFNIVGYGRYEQEIMKLSKETKNIVFHGPQSGENLYRIFSQSDCFVMTSIFEGSPLTLFEANLFHLPFVAFDIPGVHEYCFEGKNGYTLPLADTDKMINKINFICDMFYTNNDKFKRISSESHKIALKYDWAIISEKIYQFMDNNE